MHRKLRLFFIAMVVLVGAGKAWMHGNAMATLSVPGCLGQNFTIRLDLPVWQQAHCWGCYLAIGGLIILAIELFTKRADSGWSAAT